MSKTETADEKAVDVLSDVNIKQFIASISNTERHYDVDSMNDDECAIANVHHECIDFRRALKTDDRRTEVKCECGETDEHEELRECAMNPSSQKVNGEMRGCLADSVYHDHDVQCCHHRILSCSCKSDDVQCEHLEMHCNDRNSKLDEFKNDGSDEENAKSLHVRSLFSEWKMIEDPDDGEKNLTNDFFERFDAQIENVQKESIKLNEHAHALIRKKQSSNIAGKFMSHTSMKCEREMLNEVEMNFSVDVKMFDGFSSENECHVDESNETTKECNVEWKIEEHDASLEESIHQSEDEVDESAINAIEENFELVAEKSFEMECEDRSLHCDDILHFRSDTGIVCKVKKP